MNRTKLRAKLFDVNKLLKGIDHPELELDYARYYGGYCLTLNDGSIHFTQRMGAAQMGCFLDGMFNALVLAKAKFERVNL